MLVKKSYYLLQEFFAFVEPLDVTLEQGIASLKRLEFLVF